MCCYCFSQSWKSLYNTAVYMIKYFRRQSAKGISTSSFLKMSPRYYNSNLNHQKDYSYRVYIQHPFDRHLSYPKCNPLSPCSYQYNPCRHLSGEVLCTFLCGIEYNRRMFWHNGTSVQIHSNLRQLKKKGQNEIHFSQFNLSQLQLQRLLNKKTLTSIVMVSYAHINHSNFFARLVRWKMQ